VDGIRRWYLAPHTDLTFRLDRPPEEDPPIEFLLSLDQKVPRSTLVRRVPPWDGQSIWIPPTVILWDDPMTAPAFERPLGHTEDTTVLVREWETRRLEEIRRRHFPDREMQVIYKAVPRARVFRGDGKDGKTVTGLHLGADLWRARRLAAGAGPQAPTFPDLTSNDSVGR